MPRTKTTKKVVEPVVEVAPVETYKAALKVLGKEYSATGSSIKEAIENLRPDNVIKGATLLVLSKGDKRIEKIIPAFNAIRLFSGNKLTREIALKNTTILFNL